VVVRVRKVLPREPARGGDAPLHSQYAQAWAAAEAEAYLSALKKRYKAEVKPAPHCRRRAGAHALRRRSLTPRL
jgi:peptidyl-prolyl cis-trans isomerase D